MSEVPSGFEISTSQDLPLRSSATLMITREGSNGIEVMLCRRVDDLPAFPSYWAFPGGGVSRVDGIAADKFLTEIEDRDLAASLVCMLRELVEELGWVIMENRLSTANEHSRSRVLTSKEGWMEEVECGALPCEVSHIHSFSRRTTPNFAPVRFDNNFLHFHSNSIEQTPEPVLTGQTEFDSVRWERPCNFLTEWRNNLIKIPPPIISILIELEELLEVSGENLLTSIDVMKNNEGERTIFFSHGVECIPVPTQTLPPASTTNTYILGTGGDHIIVDAAAKTAEGLAMITKAIKRIRIQGGEVIGLLFTHRHVDHVGDINELQKMGPFPIMASTETAEYLPCDVDKILVEGDCLTLSGPNGIQKWQVLVTPGHCPGHVCLLSDAGLVAGDMVAGIGTILIPPAEGNMEIYLEQLERLRVMKPHLMFPSHGVVLPLPEKTLFNYIEHRQNRHQRVLKSVRSGTTDISGITNFAYSDTPGAHPILAQQQTLSHLLSHERNKLIEKRSDGWFPL